MINNSRISRPLVSVVIPNYNHARYLDQRLKSVFNQTYDNYEVIILDDSSNDNSLEVINAYNNNPHLSTVITNETNTGSPFIQWERGIQHTHGDLIWIAESDDINEITFLEEIVKSFDLNPQAVVAFSQYIIFNDYGGIIRHSERATISFNGIQFIRGWMSIQNAIKNASGAVFKKSAYNLISKDYISFQRIGDYQFWAEISAKGDVVYIRKNLTYFRTNPNSVTAKNFNNGNAIVEGIRVCKYILDNYNLSWFQKQAMNAMHSRVNQQLGIDSDIRIKMNEIWNSDKRIKALDYLYLRFISFIRKYFGILI